MLRYLACLICLAATLPWPALAANLAVRAQEIAECRGGEIATWGDGVDRPAAGELVFVYSHADAPAWFSEQKVTDAVRRAVTAWSQCGVAVELRSVAATTSKRAVVVRIQWHERDSRGNFGLANLSNNTLSLGPAAFDLLRRRNPAHDAIETLQMTISHEMGHFFGLMNHSRRCVDVLSYYHQERGGHRELCFRRDGLGNDRIEYRATLPTACDIERCRKANQP